MCVYIYMIERYDHISTYTRIRMQYVIRCVCVHVYVYIYIYIYTYTYTQCYTFNKR